MVQIFNNELFGAVAEEKEVKGIVSKLMEARHSKSMDSYELLAQFCSKESITSLILPLKEVSRQPTANSRSWCHFSFLSFYHSLDQHGIPRIKRISWTNNNNGAKVHVCF